MLGHRIDRSLTLLAASVLAAVLIVGRLTPSGPLDHHGCGMDTSFYLGSTSLMYLGARVAGSVLQALSDAVAASPVRRGKPWPLDPEFCDPSK